MPERSAARQLHQERGRPLICLLSPQACALNSWRPIHSPLLSRRCKRPIPNVSNSSTISHFYLRMFTVQKLRVVPADAEAVCNGAFELFMFDRDADELLHTLSRVLISLH